MNTAFNILVVTLSSLLGIFLVLAIILTILILKLVASVRRIAAKGEQVVDTAEAAAEVFARAAGPLGVIKAISNIVETVQKHKKGR
jgi:hypothetical protein